MGEPGRSCRLPQHLFFVLAQMIHVEIAHGFEPVLVHLDGERPHEPQATLRVRKDAHHVRAPLDLLIEALRHIRRFHMLVVGERQAVIGERLLVLQLRFLSSFIMGVGSAELVRTAPE